MFHLLSTDYEPEIASIRLINYLLIIYKSINSSTKRIKLIKSLKIESQYQNLNDRTIIHFAIIAQ